MKGAKMTQIRRYAVVDVFTKVPFKGNPVAVVIDGDDISDVAMQAIARWTNLSETTFVLPPSDGSAHYHLRIFTPSYEMPFAGHPTLGSAHALLDAGLVTPTDGQIIQQCGVGQVVITVPDDWRTAGLSFALPQHTIDPAPEPELLAAALGGGDFARVPAIVNVGPRWVIGEYANEATVRGLTPDFATLDDYDRRHGTVGQTVFAVESADADSGANAAVHPSTGSGRTDHPLAPGLGEGHERLVVRSFFESTEDPVCGSGNGSVAAYRLEHGLVARGGHYVANQGREIGRDGTISVHYGRDAIHIGGCCVTCVTGTIAF